MISTIGRLGLGGLFRFIPVEREVGLASWVVVDLDTWLVVADIVGLHLKCDIFTLCICNGGLGFKN